jgi:hypothetical protein
VKLQCNGFIDSETGEILERGRYLLDYVKPELENYELTPTFYGVVEKVAKSWQSYRGWSIAEKVYELKVPVDGLSGKIMRVQDIPIHTDILIPEQSTAHDFQPFSDDLIDDIYSELSIPPERLDPSCETLRLEAAASLEGALARC